MLSSPVEAVPLSPVAVDKFSTDLPDVTEIPPSVVSNSEAAEQSFTDIMDTHQLDTLEEELLMPACEVLPSLSVCANIHQAQYYPFWEDVLKCSSWHKKILKEGYRLDFIDGILPGSYDERNN